MKSNYIILDVETGGLECGENPITQIAWQVLSNKDLTIIDRYETYVQPYNDFIITKEALAHTQTSMGKINAGITHQALVKQLITSFDKHTNKGGKFKYRPIIVGHNVSFDMGFLEVALALLNKDLYDFVDRVPFCTMREMQRMEGYIENKKDKVKYDLTSCCERCHINLKNAHGAMNDVIATTELFIQQTLNLQNGATNIEGVGGTREQLQSTNNKNRSRKFFEF